MIKEIVKGILAILAVASFILGISGGIAYALLPNSVLSGESVIVEACEDIGGEIIWSESDSQITNGGEKVEGQVYTILCIVIE